jgi:hypothetical protein
MTDGKSHNGQASPRQVKAELVQRFQQWVSCAGLFPSTVQKYCGSCEGFCAFVGNKTMLEVIPLALPSSHQIFEISGQTRL